MPSAGVSVNGFEMLNNNNNGFYFRLHSYVISCNLFITE